MPDPGSIVANGAVETSGSSPVSLDDAVLLADANQGPEQRRLQVPDNKTEIDDILGDGDTVAVRYTCRGTHRGELFGVAPTNRTLTTSGIEMYRLSDGRIVECWGQYGRLTDRYLPFALRA